MRGPIQPPEPVVFQSAQPCSGCGNRTAITGIKFGEAGLVVALCPGCKKMWPLAKLEQKLSKARSRDQRLAVGSDFRTVEPRKVA